MQISLSQTEWTSVVTCASFLLVGVFVSHPSLSQPTPRESVAAREARMDWLQAEMSLDNSAYATTRKAIDTQIKAGTKPSTLVQAYQLQGKDIGDTRKLFRWAYVVYLQQRQNPNTNALIEAHSMMNRNLRPGAYDWIRLRFLVASLGNLEQPDQLIPVGRRLLHRVYNDSEVTLRLLRLLSRSQDKENRRLALSLAREQLRNDPTDAYKQWAVSDATMFYLRYSGLTFEENKQIIAEMTKTLRMLPAKDPNRKGLVEALVIYQLHFDANGKPAHHSVDEINRAIANTTLK